MPHLPVSRVLSFTSERFKSYSTTEHLVIGSGSDRLTHHDSSLICVYYVCEGLVGVLSNSTFYYIEFYQYYYMFILSSTHTGGNIFSVDGGSKFGSTHVGVSGV